MTPPTILTGPTTPNLVRNTFPRISAEYRIAIIGEAPGREETIAGVPFIGQSGRLLNQLLGVNKIVRDACFVGNVSQVQPPRTPSGKQLNPYSAWKEDDKSAPLYQGIEQLKADLAQFQPNVVVLLGNDALRAFFGHDKITYWRGSVRQSPRFGYKCLATYHPAAVLQQYEWMQVLNLDLSRAYEEGLHSQLILPERRLHIPDYRGLDYFNDLIHYLDDIIRLKPVVSEDIEGYVTGISCVGLSTHWSDAWIVPFLTTDKAPFWSEENELALLERLSYINGDPSIPKVLQNSLYDNFVFSYNYKMPIVNVVDDTMLKHWEAYCELPKGLDFLASIYTKQPPWKDERKNPDLHSFWRYCCTDSAVTYEINTRLDSELDNPDSLTHYHFNRDMLHPILYMELRGIRYDKAKAVQRRAEIQAKLAEEQERLDITAGRPINVNSPKFRDFLYDELQLPEQLNHKTGHRTANYEALLRLAKKTDHPVCHSAIRIRALRTRASMLGISADDDGRIRCGYNIVGTETGRLTCYTSPTGSGYNLQTIPEYDRDLFVADEGRYVFQCDLSGADGWTVAAHCARLGDPTMLDDMRAGIKIAKVVAGMFLFGPEISRLPRPQLAERTNPIPKHEPIYFGSKCCQHGTNYGMGKVLLSQTIFLQSEGKVNIPAAEAERLQNLYLMRYYGVRMWHKWAEQELQNTGKLVSASGHTRLFFGRRHDHATFKQFLAHEPQANTTYATNTAALRLWTDPANRWGYWRNGDLRLSDGPDCEAQRFLCRTAADHHPDSLIIEPLHQVHDALVGQFPIEAATWAAASIREYFNNPITIAGQTLVIPFDGAYGTSWGSLNAGKI